MAFGKYNRVALLVVAVVTIHDMIKYHTTCTEPIQRIFYAQVQLEVVLVSQNLSGHIEPTKAHLRRPTTDINTVDRLQTDFLTFWTVHTCLVQHARLKVSTQHLAQQQDVTGELTLCKQKTLQLLTDGCCYTTRWRLFLGVFVLNCPVNTRNTQRGEQRLSSVSGVSGIHSRGKQSQDVSLLAS